MKKLFAIYWPTAVFMFVLTMLCALPDVAGAAVRVTDPVGDAYGAAPFSDIKSLEVVETTADLTFTVEVADLSQGLNGALLLDTDGNRQTHGPGLNDFTEVRIEFTVAILGICWAQCFDETGDAHDLSCWVDGNGFSVELPKALLPGSVENVEVAGVTAVDFLCEGWDRVPDEGYVNVRSGELHIDREGLNLAPLTLLTDPVGDSSPPTDLKGLEVEAVGEHLVMRIHYHHSLEPHDIHEVSIGMLHLDLDGDILTGFQNATGVFPTFGVDAYVYYSVYPWALGGNVEINLTLQDPGKPGETATLQVGKHSTDSSFRRGHDWIECTLPLGLLPPVSDDAVVVIESMSPISGLFDSFPGGGGVRLVDGSVKAFNACQSEAVSISDPMGDSFAFGGDNDDLIALTACHCSEGVLCTVEYTDLQLIGEALTSMRLDVDRDASTGEPTYNFSGDTLMGVENTLVYQLSSTQSGRPVGRMDGSGKMVYFGGGGGSGPTFTAIMVGGSTGDLIRGVNALCTLNFYSERVYVTIPYRLLNDEDGLDMHGVTMSGAFGTASFDDEIPDTGVFSIPSGRQCEGDFDSDGDVDGTDLAVFAADFGRTDCASGEECEGDFDGDNDVDGSDLAIFAADFGRTDCP